MQAGVSQSCSNYEPFDVFLTVSDSGSLSSIFALAEAGSVTGCCFLLVDLSRATAQFCSPPSRFLQVCRCCRDGRCQNPVAGRAISNKRRSTKSSA